MKNMIKIFIAAVIFLMLSGCTYEAYTICYYQYENNSGCDVVVSWEESRSQEIKQFSVRNGETHTIKAELGKGGWPMPFGYDTKEVSVIFDYSRIITFHEDVYEECNIIYGYDSSIYKEIYKKKLSKSTTEYHYQYTFTPEMYERAVPIDDAEQPEIPE